MHLTKEVAKVILDGREGNASLDRKARLDSLSVAGRLVGDDNRMVCLSATSDGNVRMSPNVECAAVTRETVIAHAESFDAVTETLPE